jgi:hypothetical protein
MSWMDAWPGLVGHFTGSPEPEVADVRAQPRAWRRRGLSWDQSCDDSASSQGWPALIAATQ